MPASSRCVSRTSMHSRPGSMPVAASTRSSPDSRPDARELLGGEVDRTIHRSSAVPEPAAERAHAVRRTHSPIGTIRPVLSASGRKSPGSSRPRLGWFHRISASQPATAPGAQVDDRLVGDASAPPVRSPRTGTARSPAGRAGSPAVRRRRSRSGVEPDLARYIAMSASCRIAAGSPSGSSTSTRPTLAPMLTSAAVRSNGVSTAACSRSTTAAAGRPGTGGPDNTCVRLVAMPRYDRYVDPIGFGPVGEV